MKPSRRLLLVEDDLLVSETIAAMVEETYETVVAGSVAAALALLNDNETPTVILLDCLLPDGNPAALLAEADRRGIPVVLTSGDPRETDRIDPARPFLAKPFNHAALLKVLDGIG